MQRNIDARGKFIRLILGTALETVGLFVLVLRFVDLLDGDWPWYVGGALVLMGWLGMFGGIAGWCMLRSMGIRTPI